MKRDFAKVMMNPTRMRIAQYLILHEHGTAAEMKAELSDIPPASLYRHINVLLEAGCIKVLEEKKIRGTFEKTYGLVKQPAGEYSIENVNRLINSALLSLMTAFQKYFEQGNPDPEKDMLSLSTSTLMMTDEEFKNFYMEMGAVYNKVIQNTAGEGRKPRNITFISSPVLPTK